MREIRVVAGILVLAATIFVGLWFPSRKSPSWAEIHGFRIDPEACQSLWESRERTDFTWPETADQPVTLADVAYRFDLELALVCSANGHPPDCGALTLAPGEQVVLPLGPNSPGAVEPTDIQEDTPPGADTTP